jgi:hypothetical protein
MDTLIEIVRTLIGDYNTIQDFDDDRLQKMITIAAMMVSREVDLARDYTFDLNIDFIEPDPTDPDYFDPDAISLFTLKAACLLNQNQYLSAIGSGIKVRDGTSEVDTTGSFKGYQDIIKLGPCASYALLSRNIRVNRSNSGGLAILSPFSDGEFTTYVNTYGPHLRGRYWFDYYFGRTGGLI